MLEAATFALLRHAAPALAALVTGLRSACKLSGQLPPSLQRIYVPLIAKAGAGVSAPIRLCLSAIRAWRHIRRSLVIRWRTAAQGQLAWVNTRMGILPTDGVCRDAVRSATAGRRTATAATLADVVKCFANVEWVALELSAVRTGYPSGVLRLSLAVYGAPRRALVGRAAAPLVYPTRGIGAGSAFATDELLCFVAPHLSSWAAMRAGIGISVHVDDVSLTSSRRFERDAVRAIVEGFASLAVLFDELQLPRSALEQQRVASNGRLLRALRRSLGA